jgi:hypothetical protein
VERRPHVRLLSLVAVAKSNIPPTNTALVSL